MKRRPRGIAATTVLAVVTSTAMAGTAFAAPTTSFGINAENDINDFIVMEDCSTTADDLLAGITYDLTVVKNVIVDADDQDLEADGTYTINYEVTYDNASLALYDAAALKDADYQTITLSREVTITAEAEEADVTDPISVEKTEGKVITASDVDKTVWYYEEDGTLKEDINLDEEGTPYYIVVSGDWLSKIAERYGFGYEGLAAASGISNPNLIYPDDIIYFSGTTTAAELAAGTAQMVVANNGNSNNASAPAAPSYDVNDSTVKPYEPEAPAEPETPADNTDVETPETPSDNGNAETPTTPDTPSVEDPTTPTEEPTIPAEEPTTPTEEPTTPAEEPTTPSDDKKAEEVIVVPGDEDHNTDPDDIPVHEHSWEVYYVDEYIGGETITIEHPEEGYWDDSVWVVTKEAYTEEQVIPATKVRTYNAFCREGYHWLFHTWTPEFEELLFRTGLPKDVEMTEMKG